MQYLLLAWFIALGVAWLNAPIISFGYLYTSYTFVGILILIRKFYGNVISALYNLSKDGTTMSKQIARKSIEAINLPSQKNQNKSL